MTFHEFKEKSMMIDFVKCFRQIDGAKVGCATTFDVTINNIADRADSEAIIVWLFAVAVRKETRLYIAIQY